MNTTIKSFINACKNIFAAVILLNATHILPKQIKSLGQQNQEEAKREGIQPVNLMENERNRIPDLYTQTQAHEQIKKMRQLIQETFKDKVVPFFDIISRMITKEAELRDTHYVFYHATATMLTIMTDLYTQLYFHEHPEAKKTASDTFRFLRFEGESRDQSAREFVEKEMRAHGLIDDKTNEMMALLLSVNLSLFGSVGSKTECTWKRFVENTRSVEKWRVEALERMMDHFGLTKKYINEIVALDKDIFDVTPEALLMQIFIPKKTVDELVYLAWIRGLPASDPIMKWVKEYQSSEAVPVLFEVGKKKEKQRGSLEHIAMSREKLTEIFQKEQDKNPIFKQFMEELKGGNFSTYAYLKAYCNKPAETPYLNDTQGRILFTKEGLHNPSSGIQFYSYFSTPREKLEEYTVKLNRIVEKLIAEKEGKQVMSEPKTTPKKVSPVTPKPAKIQQPASKKVAPVGQPNTRIINRPALRATAK
jgi:hypothetical protein